MWKKIQAAPEQFWTRSNKWPSTPYSQNGRASAAKVHFVSLWPWPLTSDLENLQQCPLTRWTFVTCCTEIPPVIEEKSRHVKYVLPGYRPARRTSQIHNALCLLFVLEAQKSWRHISTYEDYQRFLQSWRCRHGCAIRMYHGSSRFLKTWTIGAKILKEWL